MHKPERSSIDDKTFEANQKSDQANGVTYSKGTISDSTGVTGNYSHDPDIAGDPAANIAAMGQIGNQGMGAIKYFVAGSVVGGVTGGVGLSALGGGAGLTTLGDLSLNILTNQDAGAIIGWERSASWCCGDGTARRKSDRRGRCRNGAKGLNPGHSAEALECLRKGRYRREGWGAGYGT